MNKFFLALMLLLNRFNDIATGEKDQHEEKDQSNQRSIYKPLMIIKYTNIDEYGEKWDTISLPNNFKISSDSTKIYATNPDEKQIYLCPAEANPDEISTLSQHCRNIDYCLFEKSFKENEEKICESAVKPILIDSNKFHSLGCHISISRNLYTFSIKYCATLDNLRTEVEKWKREQSMLNKLFACFGSKSDDLIRPLFSLLYDICYDITMKQIQWTRHKIIAPLLLENGNWEDEPSIADSNELSTEPYNVPNEFAEMDKAFRNQDESSPNYMVPRRLVPMEDAPFEIWKKSTSHFINIAPLWIELQSLMNAIDNGIRKAAITLQKRFLRKNSLLLDPNQKNMHTLVIHTKIHNIETTANPRYLDSKKKFFIPDIWCKFVYHEGRRRDIVVFVHNTPGSYPDRNTKQCNADEEVFCDFKKWAKDNLSEEVTKYAYCCIASRRILRSTLPYAEMAYVKKLLDIHDLIEGDPDQPLDRPLILARQNRTKEEIERHYFASKTTKTDHLSNDATDSESDEIHLCPAENPKDEDIIEDISIYHGGFKFCLIEKIFTDEETKMCKKEIEPLLIPDKRSSTKPHTCGPTQTDFVMKFVFAYCFSSEWLEHLEKSIRHKSRQEEHDEFTEETPLIDLYDICYNNIKMRTTYTKHRITSPSLLQEASLLNENSYDCNKISVEPYNMDEKFSNMRTAFEYQDETNPDRMTPQMLVPAEDMVLPLWKKTTCHYVNIAPLWHELVPLLDLVNTQIRNLAIKKSKELLIHTITLNYEYEGYQLLSASRNNNFNALLPIPNIWCKMVYDEIDRSGIAIIIHNSPDNPPQSHQLCEERAECDFENWLDKSKLSFDKEYLTYAYCCQVTEQVKAFYGLEELEIEGILDINNAINDIPLE